MITNICKRTMNLIYCYTNIIFMMIVYSESFEDYRCIEELKMIPDIVYTKYNLQVIQNPNKKFNQKILEPEYFYLSLYNFDNCQPDNMQNEDNIQPTSPDKYDYSEPCNPYYICYFNPEFGLHDNLKKNYEYTINNEKLSLIAVDKDQTYTGVFPKYWHKRPEFFELNQTIANIFTMYKLIYTFYDSDINFDGNLMKNKIENSVNVAINTDVLLDIKDIMMDKIEDPNPIDTVDPKFYQLNENESKLIITLMKFLPKIDESPDHYQLRHYQTVEALLFLNKKVANYIENNVIDENMMSIDRVKSLKSPYLLRRESYNFYVLRMKNMKIMPFHIDFFKNKFNLFKDQVQQKIIFDELGVNLKNNTRSPSGRQHSLMVVDID